MPINYKEYPKNWFTEIRPAVLKRANNRCENCGVHNYSVGYRDENGKFHGTCGNIFHDLAGKGLSYPSLLPLTYKKAKEIKDACNELEEEKYIVIILTIAHLDHDKLNHDIKLDRLKALCQRCHLKYDIAHHVKNRKYGRNHNKNNYKLEF